MSALVSAVFAAPVVSFFFAAHIAHSPTAYDADAVGVLSECEHETVSAIAEIGGHFASRLASVALAGNFPLRVRLDAKEAIASFLSHVGGPGESLAREGLRFAWEDISQALATTEPDEE